MFEGYERYALMRMDPALCFLHLCGPPDQKAIMAEENDDMDLKYEYRFYIVIRKINCQ